MKDIDAMKDLKAMDLHAILHPATDPNWQIIRVPGGWIYTIYTDQNPQSCVFVPEND